MIIGIVELAKIFRSILFVIMTNGPIRETADIQPNLVELNYPVFSLSLTTLSVGKEPFSQFCRSMMMPKCLLRTL